MEVITVGCLEDNYAYILWDTTTGKAAAIDPVNPARVRDAATNVAIAIDAAAAAAAGVALKIRPEFEMILTTHHHSDHDGGNNEFAAKTPGVSAVYGGDARIAGITRKLADGDEIQVGSINVRVIATPGHTSGSVCYLCTMGSERPVIFTGDTLFLAGCGRFFEGTSAQMLSNMRLFRDVLDGTTEVFCGHEYTANDLKFAVSVERDNVHMLAALSACLREPASQTVPMTLAKLRKINPFLRFDEPDIQSATSCTDPEAVIAKLREMKNNFKA